MLNFGPLSAPAVVKITQWTLEHTAIESCEKEPFAFLAARLIKNWRILSHDAVIQLSDHVQLGHRTADETTIPKRGYNYCINSFLKFLM